MLLIAFTQISASRVTSRMPLRNTISHQFLIRYILRVATLQVNITHGDCLRQDKSRLLQLDRISESFPAG
jgi:hypothetical protein